MKFGAKNMQELLVASSIFSAEVCLLNYFPSGDLLLPYLFVKTP